MNKIAFANALATTLGLVYVICALGIAFAKDVYIALINSFFHGIDWSKMPSREMTLGSTIMGLVATVIAAWILGYIFAYCYNWCNKRFGK